VKETFSLEESLLWNNGYDPRDLQGVITDSVSWESAF